MKLDRSTSVSKGNERFKNEMVMMMLIILRVTTSTLPDRIYLRIAASFEAKFFKWRKIHKSTRNLKEWG